MTLISVISDLLSDVTIKSWLILIVVFLVAYNYVTKESWRRLPPGPINLPVVGSVPFLGVDVREPLLKMSAKYGDIFTIYLGFRRVIVINGYDIIHEMFSKTDKFAGRPDLFFIKEVTDGYGIVSSEGDFWQEQRRHALHILRDFGFGRSIMEDGILEEVGFFIAKIRKNTDVPFYPMPVFQQSVSNVICKVTQGKRYDYDDPIFQDYLRISTEAMEILGNSGALNVFPYLRHLPGDLFGYKQMIRNRDYMDGEYQRIVDEHKKSFDSSQEPQDFIDAYLKIMEDEKAKGFEATTGFTNMQLIRIIGDLFAAGTETTATTLTWSLIYMTLNQDIQAKVHSEIDSVLRKGDSVGLKHRGHLPLTEACISEVQRITDVVVLGVPHAAMEDVVFRGYLIPKGTMIMPNMISVHRDPTLWPEPEKFDPKRFLDEKGCLLKREELIPFSVGKRFCLGEGLARMELFLYFVSLMQNFRFLVAPGHPPPDTQGKLGVTNIPKPFKIVIEQRQ